MAQLCREVSDQKSYTNFVLRIFISRLRGKTRSSAGYGIPWITRYGGNKQENIR